MGASHLNGQTLKRSPVAGIRHPLGNEKPRKGTGTEGRSAQVGLDIAYTTSPYQLAPYPESKLCPTRHNSPNAGITRHGKVGVQLGKPAHHCPVP